MRSIFRELLKFLSSLKLAVVVLLALAVVASVGTIYESKYDGEYARHMVYHSFWMYSVLLLLSVNLIAVMVSRWPWRRHHAPFILAHIGILTLLLGALVTAYFGVDGSVSFQIGSSRKEVMVTDQEMSVYASFDGSTYQRLAYAPVDFLNSHVERKPFVMSVGSDDLKVIKYVHFGLRDSEITASERTGDGPAIRVQLKNSFVNQTEWLRRDARKPFEVQNLGPAKLVLSDGTYHNDGSTEAVFSPGPKAQQLRFEIYRQGQGLVQKGLMSEGDSIQTSWAKGMQLHVLRYMIHSHENVEFKDAEAPNNQTTPAVLVDFLGERSWIGLNNQLRMFTKDTVYQINYNNSQVPLPFELALKDFRVERYPGTARAAAYESDVLVNGSKKVTISMNTPLQFGGFTFYQSSFEEDAQGKPTISVLSVNHDPGRPLKYLGSLLIVAGSILLFYFRKNFRKAKA